MNRKQRRIAAKQGKQTPSPAALGAALDPSHQIAQLLATALRHHQAGQLAEAEGHYRKILAIDLLMEAAGEREHTRNGEPRVETPSSMLVRRGCQKFLEGHYD